MAIIPLKQSAIITPVSSVDPDYGNEIPGVPYTLKCRFSEGVKLVRNQHGNEVVSVGTFLFDKLATVTVSDTLTYTNELNAESSYSPLTISVKRDIAGKPLLTEVHV